MRLMPPLPLSRHGIPAPAWLETWYHSGCDVGRFCGVLDNIIRFNGALDEGMGICKNEKNFVDFWKACCEGVAALRGSKVI